MVLSVLVNTLIYILYWNCVFMLLLWPLASTINLSVMVMISKHTDLLVWTGFLPSLCTGYDQNTWLGRGEKSLCHSLLNHFGQDNYGWYSAVSQPLSFDLRTGSRSLVLAHSTQSPLSRLRALKWHSCASCHLLQWRAESYIRLSVKSEDL